MGKDAGLREIGFREMRCPNCGKHWTALTYKDVNSLECPNCGKFVKVINNDNFRPKIFGLNEWLS